MSSERKGWVYVVSNPSMPGLVKIGRTDSVVEVRMKDLDTTGVAAPFKKEYEALVKNSNKLEKSVHEKLKNFRYRTNREFFECSPETASKFIKDVATELKIEILHDECFFEVIFDRFFLDPLNCPKWSKMDLGSVLTDFWGGRRPT